MLNCDILVSLAHHFANNQGSRSLTMVLARAGGRTPVRELEHRRERPRNDQAVGRRAYCGGAATRYGTHT